MSTQPHVPSHRLTEYFAQVELDNEMKRLDRQCEASLDGEVTTRDVEPARPWYDGDAVKVLAGVVIGACIGAGLAVILLGGTNAAIREEVPRIVHRR